MSKGFARITSTIPKDAIRYFQIVEVPEEERKTTGLHYKLVWIGPEEESDSSDEKEDDEMWTDEDDDVSLSLPIENKEEIEDQRERDQIEVESKVEIKSIVDIKKNDGGKNRNRRRRKNRNRRRKKCYPNSYNSSEKYDTSCKRYNYSSYVSASNSGGKIHNYNKFNSFGNSNNFGNIQRTANSHNIEPWLSPPWLNSAPNNQYIPIEPSKCIQMSNNGFPNSASVIYPPYVPAVRHFGPPNSIRSSLGILGESPYSHCSTNFQPNFMHGANNWNSGECRHYVNYQGQAYSQRRNDWETK